MSGVIEEIIKMYCKFLMRIIISCGPNGVSVLLKTNLKLSWLPYHTTTMSQFISWPQTFVAFHTALSLLVFPANIHTFK